MAREPADMHLIDDRSRAWMREWRIALPVIVCRIDDDALHGCRRVVSSILGGFAAVVLGNRNRLSVRIKEHFTWVKTLALPWIEGAVGPKAVELPWHDAGHKNVPVVIAAIRGRIDGNDAHRPPIIFVVEE